MFRYLSAIGMSEYIDRKKFASLLPDILNSSHFSMDTFFDPETKEKMVEFYFDMDVFTLIFRGKSEDYHLPIQDILPVVHSQRNHMQIDAWQLDTTNEMLPILIGDNVKTGNTVDLFLSNLIQMKKHVSHAPDILDVCVYGLSISGQILLNIQRSVEDEVVYQEQEEYWDELSRRASAGDKEAELELDEEDKAMELDILRRMQNEDIYSILEGLMVPMDEETYGFFVVLGTIEAIHKILNPYTEEWVYEFELDIIGKSYNIFINPKDLEGYPTVGMRFQGSVMLLGNVDWTSPQK